MAVRIKWSIGRPVSRVCLSVPLSVSLSVCLSVSLSLSRSLSLLSLLSLSLSLSLSRSSLEALKGSDVHHLSPLKLGQTSPFIPFVDFFQEGYHMTNSFSQRSLYKRFPWTNGVLISVLLTILNTWVRSGHTETKANTQGMRTTRT